MAVLIKRYANRKLYNTETSRYITLKGIADLLESDQEVKVIDNETGEDITSVTLSQILVDTERDGRSVPGNLLTGLLQRGGVHVAGRERQRGGGEGEAGCGHRFLRDAAALRRLRGNVTSSRVRSRSDAASSE